MFLYTVLYLTNHIKLVNRRVVSGSEGDHTQGTFPWRHTALPWTNLHHLTTNQNQPLVQVRLSESHVQIVVRSHTNTIHFTVLQDSTLQYTSCLFCWGTSHVYTMESVGDTFVRNSIVEYCELMQMLPREMLSSDINNTYRQGENTETETELVSTAGLRVLDC